MDKLALSFVFLEGVFILICIILLVYLIYRRIQNKKAENFEDREN
jgi:preprotein translocase subunit YajC